MIAELNGIYALDLFNNMPLNDSYGNSTSGYY